MDFLYVGFLMTIITKIWKIITVGFRVFDCDIYGKVVTIKFCSINNSIVIQAET